MTLVHTKISHIQNYVHNHKDMASLLTYILQFLSPGNKRLMLSHSLLEEEVRILP